MKICPKCQQQYANSEDFCSEDGTALMVKKITLPWEMEALAGEEQEEANQEEELGAARSDTFIDLNVEDTFNVSLDASTQKPTETNHETSDRTVDAHEGLSSDLGHADATEAEELPVIAPGSILGSYKLQTKLGEGGMGEVFLAEHMKLGRKVAIKVLRYEFTHNQNAVDRFFNEARAVNQIAHRHIVQITDFFEQPGGQNYYVMEYLEGRSLQDILVENGPMPAQDIVHIGAQIASALEAVHKQNIIHRDLKPENIIVLNSDDLDDYVKLLDFGVAKLLEPVEGIPLHQTQTGVIMGTPEYMAPEQLKREPVTPQTDVYAFGLILFEMTTGCRPWKYDNMGELVVAHMTKVPPYVNSVSTVDPPVPGALEQLIADCLEKEADQRPRSMKEAEERLLATLNTDGDTERRSPEMMVSGGHRLQPVPTRPPETMITGGLDASAIDKAVQENQTKTTLWAAMIFLLLITGVSGVASQWDSLFVSNDEKSAEEKPEKKAPLKAIQIFLESQPSGALVYDEKEDALLGKTPMQLSLVPDKANAKRVFIFVKDGFHKLKKEAVIADQAKIEASLLKKAPKVPPKAQKAPKANKRAPAPAPSKVKNTKDWLKKSGKSKKAPGKNQDKSGLIDPFSM
ncbi:MAG: hypothetical protein CMH56_02220 [Myxococcales bacterium]|mgnify:CR=1 FL=1|nr:hypothetical protein [Myxococcales bacterium]|tara:strand:+ start:1540 stop:3426 length:1887 start_codon:yes stop_codon:yes gene_type:complete